MVSQLPSRDGPGTEGTGTEAKARQEKKGKARKGRKARQEKEGKARQWEVYHRSYLVVVLSPSLLPCLRRS